VNFDVYCDESRPDLLGSKNPSCRFMVLGSLWLETENRESYKAEIHKLRERHKIGPEFKWQKVSPSRLDFYKDLVDWFLSKDDNLRFRCIVVDHQSVDLRLFHDDDQELGFYKFYYQLLHHWILDFNEYSVFLDYKKNHRRDRLSVLKQCLDRSNLASTVKTVQSIKSEESVLIQLVDVLLGIAAYRVNGLITEGSAKQVLLNHFESTIGREIGHTRKDEQKVNIFKIRLQGGW